MDKYLLLSFFMIIVLMAENAFVAVKGFGFSKDWTRAFDYTFCLGFYIGWGAIHLFFLVTLIIPGFYRIPWTEMYELDNEEDDDDQAVVASDYQYVTTPDESDTCRKKWEEKKKEIAKNKQENQPQNDTNHLSTPE